MQVLPFFALGLMAGSIGLGPVIEAAGFSAGFLITGAINLPFAAAFAWSMGEKIQRTEDR
ncbi:MAG: hypothetical protein K9K88_16245 [Desulfobacterales bacterium]|nr:hypothetical protein [Desulfobacterales bacterium]